MNLIRELIQALRDLTAELRLLRQQTGAEPQGGGGGGPGPVK
jgi:hypothetical protein